MRIEIHVGAGEVQVYPVNKPSITIGASTASDIRIKAEGVSRRHLLIVKEGDTVYAIDQGSTNGTFLNEERLEAGKKVEFTTFFPLRLGIHVLVSLVGGDDEDIFIPNMRSFDNEETLTTTSLLSGKQAERATTDALIKKRNESVREKMSLPQPIHKGPTKAKSTMVTITALLIFGATFYYNVFVQESEPEVDAVVPDEAAVKKAVPENDRNTSYALPDKDLVPRAKFESVNSEIKCVVELEKYLCERIPATKGGNFGVAQMGSSFQAYVDGTSYWDEAKKLILPPTSSDPTVLATYQKNQDRIAIGIYLMKHVPYNLDYNRLKDMKITFAFYLNDGTDWKLKKVSAMSFEGFQKMRDYRKFFQSENIKIAGVSFLDFMDKYITIY